MPIGQSPTAKEAQAIADELFGLYVSEEVDKVELIYTKFVSLIASEPTIQVVSVDDEYKILARLQLGW